MDITINDGFNLIYAKTGNSPKNEFFSNRRELVIFLVNNLDKIDFMSLNDIIIDKNKLINDNKILSRYLKIKKINNYDI